MLTIRAIDIDNGSREDVLEIYVGSESKKELLLKIKPLEAFENHPWITSDLITEVISKMKGAHNKRALDENAHQLAMGLAAKAPARWTVRVGKVKR